MHYRFVRRLTFFLTGVFLFYRSSRKVVDGNLAARICAISFLYFDAGVARRRNNHPLIKSELAPSNSFSKAISPTAFAVFADNSAVSPFVPEPFARDLVLWRPIRRWYRLNREGVGSHSNASYYIQPAMLSFGAPSMLDFAPPSLGIANHSQD